MSKYYEDDDTGAMLLNMADGLIAFVMGICLFAFVLCCVWLVGLAMYKQIHSRTELTTPLVPMAVCAVGYISGCATLALLRVERHLRGRKRE